MVINGIKIWATGGIDKPPLTSWQQFNEIGGKDDLSSKYTEYISAEETSIGPELTNSLILTDTFDLSMEEPVRRHSVTNINETTSILIGGYSDLGYQETYSSETYFFSHSTQKWTKGPNLNVGRSDHVSGMVTDTVTNEKYLIVIGGSGGYSAAGYSSVDSTEILMNGRWIFGKISFVMNSL